MKYEIFGSSVPVVEMTMEPGESVYTQSGGMVWQSDGFRMETNARGGVLKGLGRMFSGESFFMVTYTAQRPEKRDSTRWQDCPSASPSIPMPLPLPPCRSS